MKTFNLNTYLKRRNLILFLSITLVYFVAGKLGLQLASINASTTAVWPPTGIAIAAILLYGNRVIPAIYLGAFLVNITTSGSLLPTLGIAFGNTYEGFIAAYLVNTFAHGRFAFQKARDVFLFTILAFLSTAIAASVGTTSLLLSNLVDLHTVGPVWITWWLGDAGGALIITPLVLLWITDKPIAWNRKIITEALFLVLIVYVLSQIVFTGFFPFPYLCIPALLWAAIRFGPREAITAVFFVSVFATVNTLNGSGPFVSAGSTHGALLYLQLFLGTATVMTMTIAAIVLERKNAEEAVRNSQKRFKALIEKSADALSLLDMQGTTLYAGPSTQQIIGYTPEELVGTNAFALIYPHDLPSTQAIFTKLLKTPGSIETAEFRIKRKDDTWIWIEATGTNLLADPNVKAIVINYRDITERKRIEEAIQQEKAEDEALLESIGDGIIATDKDGKIMLVNKAFEDIVGWKQKEVLGKHSSEVFEMTDEKGKTIPEEERPLSKALSAKKKIDATHYIMRKDKTTFPALVVATPVLLDGELVGAIKVFHDITEEKAIDTAKNELISLASHQLKTPLSTINWYIELLLKDGQTSFSDKQKDYLLEVYNASKRMVYLINSLLTISRLELGTFTVDVQKVSLIATVKQVLHDVKAQTEAKKITITDTYSVDEKTLYSLESDPKLLTMIVQNLITNAIKYTPDHGKIYVEVSASDADHLILMVKDTGYGIPRNEQTKIFSKLFRASNIKVIDQQGSGLGLYIVKSTLARLGGKIWFKSEEKKGTTFYVSIPLRFSAKQEEKKLEKENS